MYLLFFVHYGIVGVLVFTYGRSVLINQALRRLENPLR